MNKRLLSVIACTIGLLGTLILLGTSIPWMQEATSESALSALQQAANRQVLFPQRAPVPSIQKKRATIHASIVSTYLPVIDQATMTSAHKDLAQKVLTTLPPDCRTHLQNFHVLYKNAKQRGLGGKTTIILDGTVPDTEFMALLIHECGHVTHANLTGTRTAGNSAFIDGYERFYNDSTVVDFFRISWETERVLHPNALSEDFISGYAKTNAFEDFAETFAAYVLHRSFLKERALTNDAIAAKLLWMETHLPLPENTLAVSTYVAGRIIPWDITKLSIEY